jgi:hypothetical protein
VRRINLMSCSRASKNHHNTGLLKRCPCFSGGQQPPSSVLNILMILPMGNSTVLVLVKVPAAEHSKVRCFSGALAAVEGPRKVYDRTTRYMYFFELTGILLFGDDACQETTSPEPLDATRKRLEGAYVQILEVRTLIRLLVSIPGASLIGFLPVRRVPDGWRCPSP